VIPDQEEREKALRAFDENILVIAGAGTGKTSLLTGRVLTALLGQGLSPDQILVTTFTEASAAEMAERIEKALLECSRGCINSESDAGRALTALNLDPESVRDLAAAHLEAGLPSMQTIHAFCFSILRDHAREADLPPDLELLDEISQEDLFNSFFKDFLENEFGKTGPAEPTKGTAILESSEWDLCFEKLSMDDLRQLIQHWVSHPRWAELPLDKDLGPLLDQARTLHEEMASHIERARPHCTKRNKNFEPVLVGYHKALGELLQQGLKCRDSEAWRNIEPYLHQTGGPSLGIPSGYGGKEVLEKIGKKAKKIMASVSSILTPELLSILEKLLKELWARYREHNTLAGMLSYDEMIERSRILVCDETKGTQVRQNLQKRYRLLLVDEFQDTDPSQNAIILSVGEHRGSLFVVGDPKQSIYRFRGADMEAYESATAQILSQGSQCTLSANFRSRPEILAFVNRISGHKIVESPGIQPPYEALSSGRTFAPEKEPCIRLLRTECPPREKAAQRRIQEARQLGTLLLERRARIGSDDAWKGIGLLVRKGDTGEVFSKELQNMGVPVLREGGKKFYERFEVQRYLALLGLMVQPHDETAFLAVLRSPIGGVPDAELKEFAIGVREKNGCPLGELLLREAENLGDLPTQMSEAVFRLRNLRERVLGLPADLALKALLQDSGLQVAEAASFGGKQRLANLNLLVEDCAGKVRREGGDLHRAYADLTRLAKQTVDFNEASLFDPNAKAVRIMTLHKAKGLEFDLTILADLSSPPLARFQDGVYGFKSPTKGWVSTFKIGPFCTPQFLVMKERKEEHEKAEERRLEYVGMTRARNELWLSWNYAPQARQSPEIPPIMDGLDPGVPIETLSGDEEMEGSTNLKSKLSFDLVEKWIQKRKRIEKQAFSSMRHSFKLPSQQEKQEEKPAAKRTGKKGDPKQGILARELGFLCHWILQKLPRGELKERMESAQAWVRRRLGREREGRMLLQACEEIFRVFGLSELQARLQAGEILGKELPILHLDAQGQPWRGMIDLLLKEEGGLVVVDYKTNLLGEKGILPLASRYQGQIKVYQGAIQQAFNLPHPPYAEIWALRGSLSYRYPQR